MTNENQQLIDQVFDDTLDEINNLIDKKFAKITDVYDKKVFVSELIPLIANHSNLLVKEEDIVDPEATE